jgi:putative restriction endonuclease
LGFKSYIGVTDKDWFDLLSRQAGLEEVNFWQPSGKHNFKVLRPGELFLFKLHSPNNFIVGGGVFAHFSLLPISLAWEAFEIGNGAVDLQEMRSRVAKYRRQLNSKFEDHTIGCIILERPFFLPKDKWIPVPADWSSNIVQGKTYDLSVEPGLSLWNQLESGLSISKASSEVSERYGQPVLSFPRLGQGAFRILVTDAYSRRCAISGERTLPVLDAAHIVPYSANGQHSVDNGLLLRKDLHALFDLGYITVTSKMFVEVSKRIKEEFENGRDYYKHHGNSIILPPNPIDLPSTTYLDWHNDNIYRG